MSMSPDDLLDEIDKRVRKKTESEIDKELQHFSHLNSPEWDQQNAQNYRNFWKKKLGK